MKNRIVILDLIALALIVIFLSWKVTFSLLDDNQDIDKIKFFEPIIKKLLLKGADTSFVYTLIKHPKTHFDEKFVRINVTGYLVKADYSNIFSNEAVYQSSKFVREHITMLNECEKKFHTPKEIIASILWIETKLGKNTGKYHIPSVYLSTAMASLEEYKEINKDELYDVFEGEESRIDSLEKILDERSEKKSEWALNEILALGQLSKLNLPIHDYKCSWAGAFGMPQFLPTSFLNFAIDGDGDRIINLLDYDDSVFSVANYLSKHGWSKDSLNIRNALYEYNNSSDYVDAVLTLATKIEESAKTRIK